MQLILYHTRHLGDLKDQNCDYYKSDCPDKFFPEVYAYPSFAIVIASTIFSLEQLISTVFGKAHKMTVIFFHYLLH